MIRRKCEGCGRVVSGLVFELGDGYCPDCEIEEVSEG